MLIALVAIVVAIALGVATFFFVEALTDDSSASSASDSPSTDPSATDPTQDPSTDAQPSQEPSQEPSTQPSEGPVAPSPTGLQCTGGLPNDDATGVQGRLLTGGGLEMPKVPGFSVDLDQRALFIFADGVIAPAKLIEENGGDAWAAVYALGGLNKANGFDDPQRAAETVLSCMTASDAFYADFTGSETRDSAATTVDGADAWEITAQIDIDNPRLTVTGDIAKVIVVETGDPATYGLFVSVVPIGDDALIAEQDQQATRLRLQ